MNIGPGNEMTRAGRCRRRIAFSRLPAVLVLLGFLLPGCTDTGSLWPSLSADDPAGDDQPPAPVAEAFPEPVAEAPALPPPALGPYPAAAPPVPASAPVAAAAAAANPVAPALGSGNFEPQPLTPGTPTGTFVGQRVQQLRADLARLQGSISQHNAELQQARARTSQDSQRYRSIVAGVNARLQVGAAPNDPELVGRWHEAQTAIERLGADLGTMSELADRAGADAGLASFLLESVRDGYGLSGAVPEDHRQLKVLEADTNRTAALIGRLLYELRDDINRQTGYLGAEQRNLAGLSVAIENGGIYGSGRRTYAGAPQIAARAPGIDAGPAMIRPLVVIHFDRPVVDYEQAVYNAASQALQRRADAVFDVVAVTPAAAASAEATRNAGQARQHAEAVLRSLTNMGLPANRISLSATTSAAVRSNEVHIYVR